MLARGLARIYARVCVCGRVFRTSSARAEYCSKICQNRAYRARRAAREAQPHCRVCGWGVDLLPIPEDAGGGWLCGLCLREGLRRAA